MSIRRSMIALCILITANLFEARSNCGSATCPLNHFRYFRGGLLQFTLSREYINQDQIYVGSSASYVGALPNGLHDEISTVNDRSVYSARLGLTDRVGLSADLPMVHREHLHLEHDPAGDRYEYWNFSGLGDAVVTSDVAILLPRQGGDTYLGVKGGVKLATGLTDVRNAAGDLAEVTLQPGTGSIDGIVGVQFRREVASIPTLNGLFTAVPIDIAVSYQSTGTGSHGYRLGNTFLAHVGSSYHLTPNASIRLQFNFRNQQSADVGTTGEVAANTGGTWLLLSPGAEVQLSEAFALHSFIQIPIYQNVNGIQQTAKFNLQLGISALFALAD